MNLLYPIVDTFCVLFVFAHSFRHLSLISPLTAYLFFHVYSFTWRAWEVYLGAPTMYSFGYSSAYEPIAAEEMERALVFATLGLIIFAAGCHFARIRIEFLESRGRLAGWKPVYRLPTMAVLQVSLAIGTVLFFSIRSGASLDFGPFSTYAGVSTVWPITCLIGIYFLTGRFWPIALPALVYLSIVSVQGFHRFMLILPTLALLGVWLYHHRRKWPQIRHWLVIVLLMIVFPNLKYIGRATMDGDFNLAAQEAKAAFTGESRKKLDETAAGFLDQFAGFLTLCDRYGKWEYGKTYTAFITLPIPRALWPGKPGLGDHIKERSVDSRPYGPEGRIITYLGESYVNFGLVGFVIIPFLMAHLLTSLYERCVRLPADSLAALTYIFVSSAFIQTYRDGVVSALMFGFVYNMPLIFIWFIHAFIPSRPFPVGFMAPLK